MRRQLLAAALALATVLAPIAAVQPAGSAAPSGPVESVSSAPQPRSTAQSTAEMTAAIPTVSQSIDRPAAAAAPTDEADRNATIPLKGGTVRPDPGVDSSIQTELAAHGAEGPSDRVWVILQFAAPPDVEELESLGVTLAGILVTGPTHYQARYAGVPANQLSAVGDLSYVRAVTPIEPEWRLAPGLEGMESATGPIPVSVLTFEPISHPDLRASRSDPTRYYGALTPSEIASLQSDPAVKWIEPRAPRSRFTSEGGPLVSDEAAQTAGFNGSGVRVGVVDTGTNDTHLHFRNTRVVGVQEYNQGFPVIGSCPAASGDGDPTTPVDDHGSNVAGIIAGNDTDSEIGGIAPQADLYVSQIFQANRTGETIDCGPSDLTVPFDDMHAQGVRIISNSYGSVPGGGFFSSSPGTYTGTAQNLDEWVRNHPNTLIVFANGNFPDQTNVSEEAIAKNVIAVGATSDGSGSGAVTRYTIGGTNDIDRLNNLTAPRDGRLKPDVNAPGALMAGPRNGRTGYVHMMGTSQAAPVVAAIAALYKQKHGRDTNAARIKSALMATSHPVDNPNNYLEGHGGTVNAYDALTNGSYESLQTYYNGSLSDGEQETHAFTVPQGAEKLVVTKTYLDCAAQPSAQDSIVNTINLFIERRSGGQWQTVDQHLAQGIGPTTRKVIDAPQSGQWRVRAVAPGFYDSIACGSSQDYHGHVRVVTEKPTLSVRAPDRIDVEKNEDFEFTVRVNGTGAPVSGVYGIVNFSAITPRGNGVRNLNRRGPHVWVAGDLSDGFSDTTTVHGTTFLNGTYPLPVKVYSTNGPRIRKTVEVQVGTTDYTGHSVTLDGTESAAYAVPVGVAPPGRKPVEPHGAVQGLALWNDPARPIVVTLHNTSGHEIDGFRVNQTAEKVTSGLPERGGWKLTYETGFASGQTTFTRKANYPTYPLPSEASIQTVDMAAGSPSGPGPIQFDVLVRTGNDPYTYEGFGAPDASHFDVSVGGRTVPTDRLTVTELRQDKYRLKFVPPTQPSSGTYNLSVAFTDEKLGASHSANVTIADTSSKAVKYSGEGSTGTASVALVLDRSGSMAGSKIDDAKDAAKIFVSDQLRDGDYSSIVSYAYDARTDVGIARVGGNRSLFETSIDSIVTGGSTNIGDGLIHARTELDEAPDVTSKAAILLTDGVNNYGYSDATVVDIARTYDARGYCVYTIAFGSGADERLLRNIASQSCGKFYQAATGENLREVYRDLRQITTGESTIYSDTGEVEPGSTDTEAFSVDDSTDRTTLSVTVGSGSATTSAASNATAQQSGSTQVRLRYPNGTLVGLNSSAPTGTEDSDIVYTTTGETTTYRLENPRPGNWSYTIQNTGTSQVSYEATATASTSTTLSAVTDAGTYVNGSTATISATLTGSSGGVTGASVRANVTRPDGTHRTVQLRAGTAGQYVGDLSLAQDGNYTARVIADAGSVHREETIEWSVIDRSSLLSLSQQQAAPSIAQGGDLTVNLTVSRPSSSTTTEATPDPDFDAAARELAASSRERIESSDAPAALKEAALALKDEARQENAAVAEVVSEASVSGTETVYLRATSLTGPNGTTIPASQVALDVATFTLAAGEGRTIDVTVSVPSGAAPGTYTGQVKATISGTVIAEPLTVNVTEATRQTYVNRIRDAARQWQGEGPSLQRYYESRMADQVASIYFTLGSSAQQTVIARSQARAQAAGTTLEYASGSGPASEVWQNTGTTYTHNLSVETNASSGPLVLTVFYAADGNVTLEDHTATLGGERVTLEATTDTTTVNGRQLTEVRFVNRSMSTNGTETLRVQSNFSLGEPGGQFTVTTGGTHGPSGAVLPARETQLTATSLRYYAGSDRVVQTSDLQLAIQNWVNEHIATALLKDVISSWISGAPVA